MDNSLDDILKELDDILPVKLNQKNCTVEKSDINYNCKLEFTTNDEAKEFAKQYSRKTLRGHTVFKNTVNVYGLSLSDKNWIDNYVETLKKKDLTNGNN